MSATNSFETALLQHIFQNANIADIGDATGLRGSSAAGNVHIALFTADPGEAGAITNEATYTGYGRVAVPRTAGGFTVVDNNVSNAGTVTFGECTAGSNTITHFAVMKLSTGDNMILKGALTQSLAVSAGITPEFAIGDLDVNVE